MKYLRQSSNLTLSFYKMFWVSYLWFLVLFTLTSKLGNLFHVHVRKQSLNSVVSGFENKPLRTDRYVMGTNIIDK